MFQKVRELSTSLAIYGLGDVAISLVNFLLLPLYVRYLTPEDYGILALLGAVEVIAKIFFRWGLDGSFMRLYYDAEDQRARQRLASTIFFFLLAVNGVLLVASVAAAPAIAAWRPGGAAHTRALQLVLLNTFAMGFTFLPFHLLRMEKKAVQFSALTLARSVATVVLRIVLIVGLGMGVLGVVVADIAVTAGLMLVLLRWFAPLVRPMFSREVLRDALRFGLPRVPHAAAQQVTAVGDKFLLALFRPTAEIGVYAMGVSFGLTLKLFLSAFEQAWAPFYYANAREPDARAVYSSVATYAFAVLTLLTAGLSAAGGDLLAAITGPDYAGAGNIVAWTALGVLFQGIYLLTSIGLNLTKHTEYYPVATMTASGANIALNLFLIPRFGIAGAAWANAAAYALQAAIAFRFSQRFYPIAYEGGRLARIAAAGLLAFAAAGALPDMTPWTGVIARGAVVTASYAAMLWLTGFFRPEEVATLHRLKRRHAPAATAVGPSRTTELAGEIVAAELPDEGAIDSRSARS